MIVPGHEHFAAQAARPVRPGPLAPVLAFRPDYLSEGYERRALRLEWLTLRCLRRLRDAGQLAPCLAELLEYVLNLPRGAATVSEAHHIVLRVARRGDQVRVLLPVEPWEVVRLAYRHLTAANLGSTSADSGRDPAA